MSPRVGWEEVRAVFAGPTLPRPYVLPEMSIAIHRNFATSLANDWPLGRH